jgi:hypothetical protein
MSTRREFITMVGGVAAWPLVARAADKRPRIAVLTLLSQQDEGGRIAAFRTGMRHFGYIAGQTLDIDYRYADGDTERLRPLARELIALAPDVFFAGEPSVARAVKALAPELPIVCPADARFGCPRARTGARIFRCRHMPAGADAHPRAGQGTGRNTTRAEVREQICCDCPVDRREEPSRQ